MTPHRRHFSVTIHADDGWLIEAGNRSLRLSEIEAQELASTVTGRPMIQRFPMAAR